MKCSFDRGGSGRRKLPLFPPFRTDCCMITRQGKKNELSRTRRMQAGIKKSNLKEPTTSGATKVKQVELVINCHGNYYDR